MNNTTMAWHKTSEILRLNHSSVGQRPRRLPWATTCAFIVFTCSGALHAAEVTTKFTIHQDEPSLVHVDLGQKGQSHGDLLAFDALVQATNGEKGKLSGFILTVDIPEKDHEIFQDRIVSMVFDLGDANTLVISGKSVYPHRGELEMVKNNPQIRAVIGGTGKYIGARGQISTTRDEDGGYTHLVELID
ncbi:MAG: hypothetical protein P1U77_25505 [Rubripirellula sp.]|nr:hypothetical protein [Rubripirellula sp.]